jgi:hypothetical protein
MKSETLSHCLFCFYKQKYAGPDIKVGQPQTPLMSIFVLPRKEITGNREIKSNRITR